MGKLSADLQEQLNVTTVFRIPIFGGIDVSESIVITWVVMAIILLLSLWFTHDLRIFNPGKRQLMIETFVNWLEKFFGDMLGDNGKQYWEYLATVLLFVAVSNLIGIFGMKPPTKDLNITLTLAVMSIVLVEVSGIRAKGVRKWAKSFTQPIAIITPINILELFIRPLSLCMRLFGNVLGAFIIMEMLKLIVPAVVPAIFSLYFDIFDGLIQAYVFVFLTSLYIKEAVEP
ncbi:MAG: F0F1 ATP synthase subunit A [Lachnospiraceae bacterium]|jgi:F-type H+-transporting ATPase subunit a|nr:F0F1 ATP synthase subunit A [Lachnospiraceae bacterium]